MRRSSLATRLALLLPVIAILVYRFLAPTEATDSPVVTADTPWGERLAHLIGWKDTAPNGPRYLQITTHVFEASDNGILPLIIPALKAGAVSHINDQMVALIRETALYYDRLNRLYPAAQFKLIAAEERFLKLDGRWKDEDHTTQTSSLTFHAGLYTVKVSPMSLDESDWLTTHVTVERDGAFVLGNRVTKSADGKPMVIGGPIADSPQDAPGADRKAVFVGIAIDFVSERTMEAAQSATQLFGGPPVDHPPHLLQLGEIIPPDSASSHELEGMSIYLTHIGSDGKIRESQLVVSLRTDYDAAALDAINRSEFVAASQGSTPVDSWMFVPVQFLSSRRIPVVSVTPEPEQDSK